ncbi:MAG TPA: alpha/beta fold hydrolase [Polyangiaceae bacterium]|jgi:hypothetical protein
MSAETIAKHLIESAARHDFAAASRDFDGTMRSALPPEKLARDWAAIEQQLGAFQAVEDIAVKPIVLPKGFRSAFATTHFARGAAIVQVVLDSSEHVAGLFFQPDWQRPPYANPAAFEERAVSVGSNPALPGMLSMPKGESHLPAVVLVHGSGPSDADESVGGVKVFKDLAWGLASRGVVVLRYVKRSRQAPAGIVTEKEEVLDGASAAIALLRAAPGVDEKRVFVLGHSQGGALAPRIAQENAPVAGIAVLAGATRPLQDSMLAQLRYIASMSGDPPALTSVVKAAEQFKQTVEDPKLAPDQVVSVPGGGTLKGAYLLAQRGYDPLRVARAFPGKILVLHGNRDYQVTNDEFQAWVTALSNRRDVSSKSYPSLNHLFVSGSGPSMPSEYQNPGHVDQAVIDDLAAWFRADSPQH